MNITLICVLIAILSIIYIWIGKTASKSLKNNDDYFLMGRKLTFFPLALTLLATQLGGGALIGAAQDAYDKGWYSLLYATGQSLGFVVLGMGFGKKLRQLNINTIPAVFEKVYQSKTLRKIASLVSIITLFFILCGQAVAFRLFFKTIGIENPLFITLLWSMLVIYTVIGGLKAVVYTDVLQVLFILFALGLALFSIDFSNPLFNVPATQNFNLGDIPWTAWFFMPLFFMLIEQDMAQRCFAAKSSKSISFSAVSAGLFLLFSSSVAVFFGMAAKNLGIDVAGESSILIKAVQVLTNQYVSSILVVAILLAVISTSDSLINSIASNIVFDFNFAKNRLSASKMLTLLIGISSFLIGWFFNHVITVLVLSYSLSVCILFIPIMFALLQKNPSRIGSAISMACGALGYLVLLFVSTQLPKELIAVLFSLFGYLGGQQLERIRKTKEVLV